MKNFRRGTKPKKPAETAVAKFCPCCRGELEDFVRTIKAISRPYSDANHVKREVQFRVCTKCGVRVVLHAFPPRVTFNDRRF